MLPNEVFALACRAYYEEQGLIVDETNGEFAHCPYPEGMGDTGYYLLHGHHQHQGILQSKDVGKCCFFVGYAKRWLQECDYFPDRYFELWDIYEEFMSRHNSENGKKVGKSLGEKMARERKGVHDPDYLYSEESKATKRKNGQINGKKYGKYNIKFATESNKKQVQITFINGKIGVYPSMTFAAIAVGVSRPALRKWSLGEFKPRHKWGVLQVKEL
jgi:hypothetical protein